MNDRKLILIHKSLSPFKTARLFPQTKWIFLGREYLDRKKWENVLGQELKINYKKKLTDISYALRDEFFEWLVEISRPHWSNWEWWITRLATRNNFGSPLFLYVCYLEVLKEIVKEKSELVIIVSESWELLDIIASFWKEKCIIIKPFYWQRRFKRTMSFFKDKLHFILSWCKFFLKSFIEWFAARLTKLKGHPISDHIFDPNHVVIHTAIDDACFGDGGVFNDRFYPGLAEYLRNKGLKVSTLIWIFNVNKRNIFETFRWFRKNNESFLIPQDYYNLIDCFRSFLFILKSASFKFQNEKYLFRGFNLLSLINYEQKLQRRDTGTAYFINYIGMFRKWKQAGYCLRTYIDFWELKNCEVPALIGIKRCYPQCKTIAYQHSALKPRLLFANYKTTKDEFIASPHADIGIANSKINKKFLEKDGFPISFIKLGPALRFKYLEIEKDSNINSNNRRNGLLICLPITFDGACEMLELCYQAFIPNQFNFKIWVKPHPMMNLSNLKGYLSFPWPESFKIVEGDMGKWLLQSKVVIVSDSSAMVESVYQNIWTVVIGKDTDIDIIPLDIIENDNLWKLVCNPEQIREVINRFITEAERGGQFKKDKFFEFDMNLLDKFF